MQERKQENFQTKIKRLSQKYQDEYTETALNILRKNKNENDFLEVFQNEFKNIQQIHNDFLLEVAEFQKEKQKELEKNSKLSINTIGKYTKELILSMQVCYDIANALKKSVLNDFLDLLFYSLVYETNNFKVNREVEPPVFYLSYSAKRAILKNLVKNDNDLNKVELDVIINDFDKKVRTYKIFSEHKIKLIMKKESETMQTLSTINKKMEDLLING